MNFQIFRILEPDEVSSVLSLLARQTFVDGKLTAKGPAREVKSNLQADRGGDPSPTEPEQIILAALQRHQEFQSFTFARRILLPTFNRYEPGMEYGWHVDSHVMGKGTMQIRTDLSMTVFLSDPASYDGGELIMETPLGEQEVKLAAGEAIVYPSTSVHRVAPVTRGVRLAAISWIQSSIRDERMRTVLQDLRAAEEQAQALGNHQLSTLIGKSRTNLMRMVFEL
jgi:PKHD-type hydroxylase